MANGELSDKQMAFAREYVIDHHKTNAAIRAGYSEKTARVQGSAMYNDPQIRAEIDKLEAVIMDELGITAYKIAEGIKDIAFNEAVKPADRLKALETLGKRLGWTEKIELSGDVVFTLDIPKPGN